MKPKAQHQLDYGSAAPRVPVVGLCVAALLVFATHFALQFVLYRERIVSHRSFADSDGVVFLLPLMIAVVGYALILSRVAMAKPWTRTTKVAFVIGVTLMAAFFSFWGSMLLPLNTYGS